MTDALVPQDEKADADPPPVAPPPKPTLRARLKAGLRRWLGVEEDLARTVASLRAIEPPLHTLIHSNNALVKGVNEHQAILRRWGTECATLEFIERAHAKKVRAQRAAEEKTKRAAEMAAPSTPGVM